MPSLPLPCIHGGDRVDLAAGQDVPTVVTIWASWCAPCRVELPEFQRYAERVGSRVRVYGVVSADTRAAATALARELGVRFPTLYDRDGLLMERLGRAALPVTLFLGPEGDVKHLYNGVPLTGAGLDRLTETHLGVAVDA
jgi:thiol-disulfide isomerase/thioredoxin